jgi:hypothetical protein
VDTLAAADMTHTILAVEDRGLHLLVEGTTITLGVVVVVVVVVVVGTTTKGNTVAPAPALEGQGALRATQVLPRLQEGMKMNGTDSMATMEGEVEMAMAIGKHAVPPLLSA